MNKKSAGLALAVCVLLMVVFVSTGWLLRSSQTATEDTVYDVSRLYLEELTAHKASQFTDTMKSQTQQLLTAVRAMGESDVASEAALREFIRYIEETGGFDFLAVVDEKGRVYTKNAVFSDTSRFPFLENCPETPEVSYGRNMDGNDLVVITAPIEGRFLEGRKLTAVSGGLDTGKLADRLSLNETARRFFCNIVMPDGRYVIRTRHDHLGADPNLFSNLTDKADFDHGTSLEQWREHVNTAQSGIAVYRLENVLHYTYYMPVGGTDWFITTTLHYDLINQKVDVIRTTLTRNSMIQLALILLVICALFAVYMSMHRRNDRLRFEKIQAEENSRAKSVFLSNMSHDIRTPMNAIIGFANLAVKNVDDTERTRDYLAKILSSGNHLLALINDVLEMSRIESGKIQLEERECSLSRMLEELNSIIQGQAQAKHLELTMKMEGVKDENVYCDKLRMNQVFLNLLGNAVKFTPEGGKISVCIQQADAAPKGCGSYIMRVKDTGIGMTPEFAAKVFEPFERERTSTVSGIQGTGLGMSITKNIVDKMNGTIDVVTAPGQGTEFILKVVLRLCEDQSPGAVKTAGTQEEEKGQIDFTGKRILLVEDNELNREIATEILEEAGFGIEEAQDGSIAVEKLLASEPGYYDLILMDIQMPVMDGYEATRTIRALENGMLAGIPIVAMTANAFEEDRQEALDTGMNGHLAKPLDTEELFALLAGILGGPS